MSLTKETYQKINESSRQHLQIYYSVNNRRKLESQHTKFPDCQVLGQIEHDTYQAVAEPGHKLCVVSSKLCSQIRVFVCIFIIFAHFQLILPKTCVVK